MLFEILQAFLSVTLPSLNETLPNVDVLVLHKYCCKPIWLADSSSILSGITRLTAGLMFCVIVLNIRWTILWHLARNSLLGPEGYLKDHISVVKSKVKMGEDMTHPLRGSVDLCSAVHSCGAH